MKERAAVLAALAVGGASVVGLFFLSRRNGAYAPQVVAQTLVGPEAIPSPGAGPSLGQKPALMEMRPPSVRIDLRPSPALRRLGEAGDVWEYRVVDAKGRVYLVESNADEKTEALFVPATYGSPVAGPRLEVWTDEGRVGSAPLGPMPPPVVRSLKAKRDVRIRAFHLPTQRPFGSSKNDGLPWGQINFLPGHPLPKDEYLMVEILETSLTGDPRLSAAVLNDLGGPARMLYADDVSAVRVRVSRIARRSRRERVAFPEIKVVRKGSESSLAWKEAGVANGLGMDIRLVEPAPAPEGRPRPLQADLAIEPLPHRLKPSERYESFVFIFEHGEPSRQPGVGPFVSGSSLFFPTPPGSPNLDGKTFRVSATAEKHWTETLDTFETTIPVEP